MLIGSGGSLRKKRKPNGKRDIDLRWIIPALRWSNAYSKTLEEKELEIERKGTEKEEAAAAEEFPFLIRGNLLLLGRKGMVDSRKRSILL
jgi:hypothetical protein